MAVFGIYPTYQKLEAAVDELRNAGFRNTDISFLMPENVGSKDLVHTKASKAPEGAVVGAGASGALSTTLPPVAADFFCFDGFVDLAAGVTFAGAATATVSASTGAAVSSIAGTSAAIFRRLPPPRPGTSMRHT